MDIIVFDICGLIITGVLILSMISRRLYDSRANKILLLFMLTTFFATLSDLSNAIAANYWEVNERNIMLLYVFNFAYFATHNLILLLYILYIYASVDIWHIYQHNVLATTAWKILFFVEYLLLIFNGVFVDVFSISKDMKYVRGPYLMAFYAVSGILCIWSVVILFKYRALINKDKAISLILVLPLVGAGIVIQFINQHILIEMFLISLALLFFMVIVRREENQLDPIVGALTFDAGVEKVTRNFKTRKPETVLFIKIRNYHNLRLYLGQMHYNTFLRNCAEKFREFAKSAEIETELYFFDHGLFAFIIEGLDKESVDKTAQMCRDYLINEIIVDDFSVFPDPRINIVRCPEDVSDFSVLYTVGTTFHHTMPDNNEIHRFADYKDDYNFKIRNEIKDILKRGLERGNFSMYYQPIFSTKKGRFISAEALIRLNDDEYGTISPGLFIPMAELEGSIHEIGDFVIKDVIRFISENDIEKLGLEYIEMNLSASQCIEVDLVDKIKNTLEKYNVRPEQLSLELTENAADMNPVIVDQNIETLHKHGVRIALDDYGTGYSNIKRVVSLPIDQVKLDKSFVDMVDDTNMWIVIQDTIKMLKDMGKEVLIEGVEKENVADKFRELNTSLFLGCELMQGFYFCKPLPEKEFIEFIKEHMNTRGYK